METNQINHELNHAELREIGLQLKSLRARKGLTMEQLVASSNGELKMGTVAAIEKGRYNAGIRQLIVYVRLLGYRVAFLPTEV